MTRRFALSFIALLLTQFCAVYAWQRYDNNEEMKALTISLTGVHETTITDQEKMVSMQIRSYESLMEDLSKIRFAPLLRFVTEHYAAYQTVVNDDGGDTFRENSMAFAEAVSTDYEAVVTEKHLDFDLSEDQAKRNCASNKRKATEALRNITNVSHEIDPALQRNMIRIMTLSYLQDVLFEAMSMSGGKSDGFDSFFPVFNAERCSYKRGDTLNAFVSVGSYSNALDPENVKLTVDGQELVVGPSGLAKFNAPAGNPGDHTLKTKVVVTNPLTGEVRMGEGSFTYRVE